MPNSIPLQGVHGSSTQESPEVACGHSFQAQPGQAPRSSMDREAAHPGAAQSDRRRTCGDPAWRLRDARGSRSVCGASKCQITSRSPSQSFREATLTSSLQGSASYVRIHSRARSTHWAATATSGSRWLPRVLRPGSARAGREHRRRGTTALGGADRRRRVPELEGLVT